MTEFQVLRNRKTGQYVTNTMKAVDGSPVLIWGERSNTGALTGNGRGFDPTAPTTADHFTRRQQASACGGTGAAG